MGTACMCDCGENVHKKLYTENMREYYVCIWQTPFVEQKAHGAGLMGCSKHM